MNRVVAEVTYSLAAKYKISYEIRTLNKLMELRSAARFIKSLKRYSVLSSRPSNVLVMSIRPYISSDNNVELIDFT
jgi:hypothetical protein